MTANKKTPAIAIATTNSTHATDVHIVHKIITLAFANGESIQFDTAELSNEVLAQAMAHGLKQKLADAAAISRDPSNGRAASIEIKHAAVKEVFNRLLAGEWNKRREGGGNTGGLLFRALCEMYEGRKTPEQIKEYLATLSDKEKAALRKNPRVAEVIDRLRMAEGEDSSDDLLAGLEGDE